MVNHQETSIVKAFVVLDLFIRIFSVVKNGNAIVGNFLKRKGNVEKGRLGCSMFIELENSLVSFTLAFHF